MRAKPNEAPALDTHPCWPVTTHMGCSSCNRHASEGPSEGPSDRYTMVVCALRSDYREHPLPLDR